MRRSSVIYHHVAYLCDDEVAGRLDALNNLLYRSSLLGAEPRMTNIGGSNTSAKLIEKAPVTGEGSEVLLAKGSGGDLRHGHGALPPCSPAADLPAHGAITQSRCSTASAKITGCFAAALRDRLAGPAYPPEAGCSAVPSGDTPTRSLGRPMQWMQ